jgi:hypothetical protein
VGWGSGRAQGVGIPVGHGSGHPTWSWGSAGPDGQGLKGQGSQRTMDPVRAGVQSDLRGGDPGGAEQWQWLCRSTVWGLGSPAVIFLDCGVEKPSTMYEFRVLYFGLFLVLPQPSVSPAAQQSPWFRSS